MKIPDVSILVASTVIALVVIAINNRFPLPIVATQDMVDAYEAKKSAKK